MSSAKLEPRHTRKYPPLDPAMAERLRDYFVPHDAALARILGRPVSW
jgi:hypothetical protein